MSKYKRVVISGRGGTDVLKIVEEDVPEPKAGEVRVRVLAAWDQEEKYKG
jgi:NADPH2:quinone reductase